MKTYTKKAAYLSLLTMAVSANINAAPPAPQIAWLAPTYDYPAPVDVVWNMWWGENGTSWQLTNNGSVVCHDSLIARGNEAQSGQCSVDLVEGANELVVMLKNNNGATASTPKTLMVSSEGGTDDDSASGGGDDSSEGTPATGSPAKPVIAWMASHLQPGSHTISWNMWWGNNGDKWSLVNGDEELCKGTLTMNGQQAQKGTCSVNLTEGRYELQVLLSNTKGSSASDIKVVNVSDTGTDSGGGSDGGGESNGSGSTAGSGDEPLYTQFGTPQLRQHRPYANDSDSVVGSYFVEWGIYGRNYHPADVPAANLTHVLYGFIPICGPNDSLKAANSQGYSALVQQCRDKKDFEVTIHDRFAAIEKSYPGDQWDQDYKGTFNQFRRIKKAYPDLKVLPSIGGWTLSDPFFYLGDKSKRETFIHSVVDFLRTYSFFDGVDIDWEFPGGGGANTGLGNDSDGETYVVLMRELRHALDDLSKETGKDYEVTSAIGASPEKIARVDYSKASQYMDYIFMMTYDYYGAWNGELGHQTGIHGASNAIRPEWNLDGAVKAMEKQHVPGKKLVAGVAMYGRGWENVTDVEGDNPFTGTGQGALSLTKGNGHWEDGVVDYFRIVEEMLGGNSAGVGVNGWQSRYDVIAEAPYLWNPQTRQLITYDNPRSTKAKAEYVKSHGLGGAFSWEIDADNGEILNAIHEGFKHPEITEESNFKRLTQ